MFGQATLSSLSEGMDFLPQIYRVHCITVSSTEGTVYSNMCSSLKLT